MTPPLSITAMLGPDNVGDGLAALVAGTGGKLDVAAWEVGPSWARLLGAAAGRGCRVRVLLDDHAGDGANAASAALLGPAGAGVRRSGRGFGAEAHWKLLAGGSGTAAWFALGSGNLLARDAPRSEPDGMTGAPASRPLAGTREWWVSISRAPHLIGAASAAFESAWRAAPGLPGGAGVPAPPVATVPPAVAIVPPVGVPTPQVAPVRVAVDPARVRLATSAPGCAELLLLAIGSAADRLDVTVPYVHDHAPAVRVLLDGLAAAVARGVPVRLLLGTSGGADPIAAPPERLARLGVACRVMDPARSTTGHAKGLVTGELVVLGSSNWSEAGLRGNLEAALGIHDDAVAAYFGEAFERDWRASG